MNPLRRSVLEQKAQEIQKLKGLKWMKALDEAAKEFGFNNFRHYQNMSKEISPKGKPAKVMSDLMSFPEFLAYLKGLNSLEVNDASIKHGMNVHVENYLRDIFNKGHLRPGGYFPNSAEKLELEFLGCSFEVAQDHLKIKGKFLIQIKLLVGENYARESSVKRSDRFDGTFLILMDSKGDLSLSEAKISDESFGVNS